MHKQTVTVLNTFVGHSFSEDKPGNSGLTLSSIKNSSQFYGISTSNTQKVGGSRRRLRFPQRKVSLWFVIIANLLCSSWERWVVFGYDKTQRSGQYFLMSPAVTGGFHKNSWHGEYKVKSVWDRDTKESVPVSAEQALFPMLIDELDIKI